MYTLRRSLIGFCAAGPALAALPARGAVKRRVGVLFMAPKGRIYERFIERMRSLGWDESSNVDYLYEWATDEAELTARARALAVLRPEVVVTGADPAARAAVKAIPGVPIVMGGANDPVGSGWVNSLRRPGRRVTGTAWAQDSSISGKYVDLASRLVPDLGRLGVAFDPTYPGIDTYRTPLDAAARRLGIAPQYVEVSEPARIDPAFEALRVARVKAVVVLGSIVSYQFAGRFAAAGQAARLPTIHIFRHAAEQGGTVSYGPSWQDLVVRTADYVDKILRGANPADLPVAQPTTYELIVNLRAARAIGLSVPQSILALADEVIE